MKTAESVSPKHPDKICDRISDAILDAHLAQDPSARVAVDVAGGHGIVFVTGEITSRAKDINIIKLVKSIAGEVAVTENIALQSSEIANGVDTGGAGDQGIMVGYATSETIEMLPLEVVLSRNLNQYIYKKHPYDGKTQVTLDDKNKLLTVVASFQNVPSKELKELVSDWLVSNSKYTEDKNTVKVLANPAGDWNQGGFDADAGLTGRKLAVDNYGPRVPIGGGAFSGKDPSKVDRSAAYMARKIAVDYLKNKNAKEVFVRLAYAIGYKYPVEATVIVDGIAEDVEGYDLTPNGIIKELGLKRPMYASTAEYGHFGNNFTWDK